MIKLFDHRNNDIAYSCATSHQFSAMVIDITFAPVTGKMPTSQQHEARNPVFFSYKPKAKDSHTLREIPKLHL
jgi:hypothetical protein